MEITKCLPEYPFPFSHVPNVFCPERREKGKHLRFHPVIISRGEEQKRGSKQKGVHVGFCAPILWESAEPTHPTQEGERERPHATSDVLTFRVFISRTTHPVSPLTSCDGVRSEERKTMGKQSGRKEREEKRKKPTAFCFPLKFCFFLHTWQNYEF